MGSQAHDWAELMGPSTDLYSRVLVDSVVESSGGGPASICEWLDGLPEEVDEFGDPKPVLFVIDQFETVLDPGHDETWLQHRRLLFEDLARAIDGLTTLHLLLVVAEERLPVVERLLGRSGIERAGRFALDRLSPSAARAAVNGPAAAAGIPFEEGAARRLVEELSVHELRGQRVPAEGIDPAQLQVVCSLLYRDAVKAGANSIDEEGIARMGGASGALAEHVEQAVHGVSRGSYQSGRLLRALGSSFVSETGGRRLVIEGRTRTGRVPNDILDALQEGYGLVRTETRGASRYWELSLDSLVRPVSDLARRQVERSRLRVLFVMAGVLIFGLFAFVYMVRPAGREVAEPPSLTDVEPNVLPIGSGPEVVTLTGAGFTDDVVVLVDDEPRTPIAIEARTIDVELSRSDLREPGTITFVVETAAGDASEPVELTVTP